MITPQEVEALERLYELEKRIKRDRVRKRRLKKVGLGLMFPILGPVAGELWAENEHRGWQ